MFDIHDVVFVRYEGYPMWPAKVIASTAEHLRKLHMTIIPSNMRLVLFYNDNGLYDAVQVSDLRSIDDPRLQKKTRQYEGPHTKELRVALKEALEEHRPAKSEHIPRPSPPTSPTHRKRRKKPAPSQPSHPTSPVTGHSDLRQSALSQRSNPAIEPSKSPASPQTSSKPMSPSPLSVPPTTTSRTNPRVSVSTPPSRSRQSSTLPIPVKLRVRHKRSSAAIEAPLQSPHSDLSFPSPMQTHPQPSPKRRRRDANTEPNCVNQSQTEQSNGKDLDPPKRDITAVLANTPHETTKPHTGTDPATQPEKPPADTPVTGKRNKIAPSSSELHRCHENENPKILGESQKPAKSDQFKPRPESQNDADNNQCVGRRRRPSRVKTTELSQSEDEPDASGSSSSEREEQNTDIRSSRIREKSHHVSDRGRAQNNTVKRGSRYGEKPSKRRKTDESRKSGSLAFDMLSKKDSSEVIEKMMNTIRFLHVERWQDGYKRARAREIVKTEKEMSARCKAAIRKAEMLLRLMKGEETRDKRGVSAEELEAFQAVRDMRGIYFDVKTMNLRKVGRKLMSLGRKLERYSTMVWSAIRDVLVMWADLTTEDVNQDAQERDERTAAQKEKSNSYRKIHEYKKEDEGKVVESEEKTAVPRGKSNSSRKIRECKKEDEEDDQKVVKTGGGISTEKIKASAENGKELAKEEGSDKKGISAREERLMKFDRKTLVGAVDSILAGAQEDLKLDEMERTRFTREVEEAIDPRFEEDRSGYYKASVKVIKALKRAFKDPKAHSMGDTNRGTPRSTSIFVSAIHDETGEKARLLVTRLLGR